MAFQVYSELKYVNPIQSIEDNTRQSILEIVSSITSQAKALCPVGETGQLRASIGWEMEGKSGGFEDVYGLGTPEEHLTAYVGSNVFYAIYVECGTRYMAAIPYIRPAIAIYAQGQAVVDVMKRWAEIRQSGALKADEPIKGF